MKEIYIYPSNNYKMYLQRDNMYYLYIDIRVSGVSTEISNIYKKIFYSQDPISIEILVKVLYTKTTRHLIRLSPQIVFSHPAKLVLIGYHILNIVIACFCQFYMNRMLGNSPNSP